MDETIDCLIRYMGGNGIFYDKYNDQLSELGFLYQDKMELPGLGLEIFRYSYHGADFEKDRQSAQSLDSSIQIVVNKEINAMDADK